MSRTCSWDAERSFSSTPIHFRWNSMGFTGVIHPEWVGNTQGARSCPARCIGPCSDVSDVPISRLGGVFTERGHLPVPRRAARITPVSMRSPRSAQCLFLARFARGYCCAWGSVLTTEYTPPRIARAGCCGRACGTFRACGKRSRLRSEEIIHGGSQRSWGIQRSWDSPRRACMVMR